MLTTVYTVKNMMARNIHNVILTVLTLATLILSTSQCRADEAFDAWLKDLRTEAITNGISPETLDIALKDLRPVPRVIELDRNQPEFKLSYRSYQKLVVTESRINKGAEMLRKHRELLEKIKARYGVQPRFLVAVWGLETNFGSIKGKFPVIEAVATLAYDSRRGNFFRTELLHSLRILDKGHINISDMVGSWAGAMGQIQFMPSTFTRLAVDEDNDGRKDIWHSLPDVFGSAANFLSSYGWMPGYTWGRQVKLPEDFNDDLIGTDKEIPLSEWQEKGVRLVNGEDLPDADISASLIQPSKGKSPSFLVYRNYKAILRWNRSNLYAIAVCRLADRIGYRASMGQ
jgi:membrane-bound lytic murein transglycosylase B